MKKTLKCLLLLLLLATNLVAATGKKIDVYYQGSLVDSYSLEEFTALVENSEILLSLTEAEKAGEVYILLSDPDYALVDDTYTGYITIVWKNKDVVLKEIKMNVVLTLSSKDPSTWQKIQNAYTKTASYSLPVVIVLLLIFIP